MVRLIHEAQLHVHAYFLTLTYSDDHLPSPPSLSKRDFQLFMKRLRKGIGKRVSFFGCGEYGDTTGRPHYHLILFGYEFPDKRRVKIFSDSPYAEFSSAELEALWGLGRCHIGTFTPESAKYVASYTLKRVTGDAAELHYTRLDAATGELYEAEPEFALMSRRPAIGRLWFERFQSDIESLDRVVVRNKGAKRVPRYYDKLRKTADKQSFDAVKYKRIREAKKQAANSTPRRLQDREIVTTAKANLRKGKL